MGAFQASADEIGPDIRRQDFRSGLDRTASCLTRAIRRSMIGCVRDGGAAYTY